MILRYLVLFGGIVLMITGCNSLVSQNFGTHRLRTLDVSEATALAIGEADFVEIAGAEIGKAFVTSSGKDLGGKATLCRPLLSPEEQSEWEGGATVSTALIGCFKTANPACLTDPECLPYTGRQIIGLIGEPAEVEELSLQWDGQRIVLENSVVYVQLGEQPQAWYWNLLLMVGGICLALIPEAIRHNRAPRSGGAAPKDA